MPDELGKIEKPSVAEFKKGRKLYFIPLLSKSVSSSDEYTAIYNKYWDQVEKQISDLEFKLGKVNRIYHELIPSADEDGFKVIKELNDRSYQITKDNIEKDARLEVIEDGELLTEFMDWSRCLLIGLQNQKVLTQVYESYIASNKKRNEYITNRINETLKADEIGIIFIREGHQIQFPLDVEVFYIAPPALDEINRWLRDHESK